MSSGTPHPPSDGGGFLRVLINPLLGFLVILFLVVWGTQAMFTMPKEKFPDVSIPVAVVIAVYPGAPPELVEKQVTNVLERKFKVLPRLDSLASSTIESAAIMVLEFDVKAPVEESHRLVAEKIEEARNELPEEVDQIMHKRVSVNNAPILTFNLVGNLGPSDMRRVAFGIQDEIEAIEGVSELRLSGIRQEQLQVLVNRHRLEAIGGSLNDVVFSLKASQDEAPLGRIQSEAYNYLLQVERVGLDIERLKLLPVRSATTGESVPLQDVATVQRALSEQKEFARLVQISDGGEVTGADTVTFDVLRQPGSDLVELADTVKEQLGLMEPNLPPGSQLVVTMDRSQEVKDSMHLLFENGWQDLLMVMATLFMFLGVRESIVASLSIPLTFLATFAVLDVMGHTINSLSLMALLVAIGILVDNFILALEGMHEAVAHGMSAARAAIHTIRMYAVPALTGSLATISSFMPMASLDGIDGKFIQVIPIAVSITLILSYALSFSVTLAVGSVVLKKVEAPNAVTAFFDRVVSGWAESYYVFMKSTLATAGRRWTVVLLALGALGLSLVAFQHSDQVLYPASDYPMVGATLYLPPGTSLAETRRVAEEVEKLLVQEKGTIKQFVMTAGQKSSLAFTRPQAYLEPFRGEHMLGVNIELTPLDTGRKPSWEVADDLRDTLMKLAPGRLEIHQIRMGPSGTAPVEVLVTGSDLQRVRGMAEEISQIMQEMPGLVAVRDNRKDDTGGYRVELDDEALKYHNLSRTQILMFLRSAIDGKTADTVLEGEDKIDIRVAYDWRDDGVWNSPNSAEELLAMKVSGLFTSASVPLASVGDLEMKTSPSAIDHVFGDYAVLLQAEVVGGTPIELANALGEKLKGFKLEQGEALTLLGDKAKSEQTQSELAGALALSIAAIFVIMLLLFESVTQTLIVMTAVPFALIGVFFGFYLQGIPFSFPAMVGVVSLSGIVVNNSIILLVTANIFRTEGMDLVEAMQQAGRQRLRPVLSTTLTSIVGLLPMAFTDPVWQGLCMAIVYGLTLSTVLVLVVVPTLYVMAAPRLNPLSIQDDEPHVEPAS